MIAFRAELRRLIIAAVATAGLIGLSAPVAGPELPTQQSLGFAAAPVPTDYAAPPADPTYIWDLAATDVFPVAADPDASPESPGADLPDEAPEGGPG